MLEEQNNACFICGLTTEQNGKSLAVDHNHKTGQIRKLLCSCCNVAVGFLQENPQLGHKIAEYLQEV